MAEVLIVGMLVLEGCFEIWLFGFSGDGLEPPLLFKDRQPHFRSFWMGWSIASFAVSIR